MREATLKNQVLFGCLAVLLMLGTIAVVAEDKNVVRASVPSGDQSGPLDGMVFSAGLGPEGKPKDVEDVFVFAQGTFVSKECELRCDYPARPYFVRKVDGKTEFISHTKCPYKDAAIVWRGTVEGDRIYGTATWTLKRWYWTVTETYDFEGELERSTPSAANTQ